MCTRRTLVLACGMSLCGLVAFGRRVRKCFALLVLVLAFLALLACHAVLVRADSPEQVDLLIRGGTVVTMDSKGRVLEDGAVAVRGAKLVAVGATAELTAKYKAAATVDATGRVVMPGLINTHTHAPM